MCLTTGSSLQLQSSFLVFNVCVFAWIYVCAPSACNTYRVQKGTWDLLELELQVIVSFHVLVGLKLGFSTKAVSALSSEPSPQLQHEDLMLREIVQSQKDTYCMIPLECSTRKTQSTTEIEWRFTEAGEVDCGVAVSQA